MGKEGRVKSTSEVSGSEPTGEGGAHTSPGDLQRTSVGAAELLRANYAHGQPQETRAFLTCPSPSTCTGLDLQFLGRIHSQLDTGTVCST